MGEPTQGPPPDEWWDPGKDPELVAEMGVPARDPGWVVGPGWAWPWGEPGAALQNGKHDEAWMVLKQVHDTNMRAKGHPERVFSVRTPPHPGAPSSMGVGSWRGGGAANSHPQEKHPQEGSAQL